MKNILLQGDCLEVMKTLPENSVDSIVTDPPYGLSFMGKKWDYDVPSVEIWKEAMRVLKPGGHLLSFAGSRTYHRMAVNIEDAGFEIRDQIMWVYGSGFPKSYNIGKNLDKYLKTGNASWNGTGDSSNGGLGYTKLQHKQGYRPNDYSNKHQNKDEITQERAKEWEGWGTALKPAHEPIVVARKPLSEKTIANNVLEWGTGGINIDGCRVGTGDDRTKGGTGGHKTSYVGGELEQKVERATGGRFPANFIHDGSDEVVELFPETKSVKTPVDKGKSESIFVSNQWKRGQSHSDSGNASRFFMTCKDTQRHAIMSVCNDINVNNVGSNLMISQLTEKIVKIHSVLRSATPNLDLLNQNLNALFVEQSAKNTEIDFVAKLVAIKEAPEDLVSREELRAILGFIGNCKGFTPEQKLVYAVTSGNIDITQITTNLLKLCGYVLSVIDENTQKEKGVEEDQKSEQSRLIYQPKASKKDRNEGLEDFEEKANAGSYEFRTDGSLDGKPTAPKANFHPTVKPTKLMQYLVRLVTPKGGTVLDPFMGSGSTGKACKLEGFNFTGIEMDEEYIKIAEARINNI